MCVCVRVCLCGYSARQLIFVALAVMGGHRTSVWRHVTVAEWATRMSTADGIAVVHAASGKTRKKDGPTTLHVEPELACLIEAFFVRARPLLCVPPRFTGAPPLQLLPALQRWEVPGRRNRLEELLGLPRGMLGRLMLGNSIRQYHASVTHHLAGLGVMPADATRRLATYRRHSQAVAQRVYDRRNATTEDMRSQRELLDAVKAFFQR